MTEKEFSERLTQLRLQKGVSARDMSLSLGQNEGYIHSIESGRVMPSLYAFFNICDYFHITPKDFFDLENSSPAVILEIVEDMKKLNNERLLHIHAIIKDMIKAST